MRTLAGGTATRRVAAAAVVFVASLFVFDRAFSAGLASVHRWVEARWNVRARLAALPDKPAYRVLVLGTSRTFEAIHPAHIERALGVKAFKEASKGKGPRYAYEFYRLYRELVGKPRVVLYGVDYFIFGLPTDPSPLAALGILEGPEKKPGRAFVPLRTLARKDANDRTIVRILERAQRGLVSSMQFDPEADQADMAAYRGRPESRVVPVPRPARFERAGYTPFPGLEGEYLVRLLEACRADGVALMLVYPPDYEATRVTNYEHDRFVAALRGMIAGASHASFHDYNDPARFPVADPALFWDGGYGNPNSHLNGRGAERFARLYLPDLAQVLESAARQTPKLGRRTLFSASRASR